MDAGREEVHAGSDMGGDDYQALAAPPTSLSLPLCPSQYPPACCCCRRAVAATVDGRRGQWAGEGEEGGRREGGGGD